LFRSAAAATAVGEPSACASRKSVYALVTGLSAVSACTGRCESHERCSSVSTSRQRADEPAQNSWAAGSADDSARAARAREYRPRDSASWARETANSASGRLPSSRARTNPDREISAGREEAAAHSPAVHGPAGATVAAGTSAVLRGLSSRSAGCSSRGGTAPAASHGAEEPAAWSRRERWEWSTGP